MSQLFCIILAGGLGSRLWPVSRASFPKQMLKLDDEYTLFQRTFLNLANLIDDKNIITAVNVKYVSSIKEQLKEMQEKFCRKTEYKIVSEPLVKNTAPAVTLAAKYIEDNLIYYDKQSPIILVVPSDEIFSDRDILADTLEQGIELAKNGYIVAYGTKTKQLDKNMTYFKAKKNPVLSKISPYALKVSEFINENHSELENEKVFYMNTGIYMFSYDTYMNELKKYSKEIHSIVAERTITNSIPSIPLYDYSMLQDVSIEDILISNTKKLAFLELAMDWKDIGSWDAVYDVSKKDDQGNCLSGKVIDIDSENSLVYSTDKLIATLGLKDKIVVSTEDAVFVCDKNKPNSVKKIYKKLNDKNSKTKEIHKTVYRPWGYYTVLEDGDGFITKCITVNPQAKLSLQRHFHRSEHWIVLEGIATVIKGDSVLNLHSGESVDIAVEEIHSLQNLGNEQIKILEVQQGDVLDENDIERLEDIYGRV